MPSSVYLGRKRKSKTIYRPARFHHQSETRRVILNRVAVALKSRRFPSFSLTIARQYSFRSNDYMERHFSPIFTRASYLSIGLLPSSIQTNYFFETAITQVHWMKNHNILKMVYCLSTHLARKNKTTSVRRIWISGTCAKFLCFRCQDKTVVKA